MSILPTKAMNKNEIILEYLKSCPGISRLYFQYGEAAPNTQQLVTSSVETSASPQYIDGSRPRQLDYSLIWFKPLAYIPVTHIGGNQTSVNAADLDDVQSIIDWIDEQNAAYHLPDFGAGYHVDSIRCLHDVPQLIGIDRSTSPPLARYTFTIRVEYLDMTRCNYR